MGKYVKRKEYLLIDLVGTSPASVEDAINNATQLAHKKVTDLSWFLVSDINRPTEKGIAQEWQVTIKACCFIGR